MMDKIQIGKLLKDLRIKKGETQEETAKAINVTQESLSYYETGDRLPSDEVKVRIAKHFGTSVESLFFSNIM